MTVNHDPAGKKIISRLKPKDVTELALAVENMAEIYHRPLAYKIWLEEMVDRINSHGVTKEQHLSREELVYLDGFIPYLQKAGKALLFLKNNRSIFNFNGMTEIARYYEREEINRRIQSSINENKRE